RNVFPEQLPSRTRVSGVRDNLLRKFREMKVARQLEARFPKERILELYLNQIPLGAGAYGVESAAQRYFGKAVTELNVAEAAMLAALPKAPARYNPRRFPDRAIQRRNSVLELMRRGGALADADASTAKAYPLRIVRTVRGGGDVAPYFVEWVRRILAERYGTRATRQGLRVITSLDLDLQGAAERAIDRQLRAVEAGVHGPYPHLTYEGYLARAAGGIDDPASADSPYLQGAFVAIDPRTGGIRALVGGRDYDDSKFDRATQALRQPGSTFKPFVYAAAVQAGRSPSAVVDDSPIEVSQADGSLWSPKNFDNTYEGEMSMRRALYMSRNLPAVKTAMEVGEGAVADLAHTFGLTTEIPPYPSIALGTAEVQPLELIAAYATFANLGWRVAPNPLVRVETIDGRVLEEAKAERIQVLTPEAAWLMVDMMKDVVSRGSGTAIRRLGFQLPTAGKTGTTSDYSDVWYVGYTSDLVAGVWMGFDRRRRIKDNAQGGQLAAPAWAAFMREVYARRPASADWARPIGVSAIPVDERTGQRLPSICPVDGDSVRVEYFLAGTEPAPSGICRTP
ncbi:MAG: penicillin-binding protein 1A, partial [Gemmatimonadota bacterium]